MKPKGVTTHIKALDEYILMATIVLLLRVQEHNFLQVNET